MLVTWSSGDNGHLDIWKALCRDILWSSLLLRSTMERCMNSTLLYTCGSTVWSQRHSKASHSWNALWKVEMLQSHCSTFSNNERAFEDGPILHLWTVIQTFQEATTEELLCWWYGHMHTASQTDEQSCSPSCWDKINWCHLGYILRFLLQNARIQ